MIRFPGTGPRTAYLVLHLETDGTVRPQFARIYNASAANIGSVPPGSFAVDIAQCSGNSFNEAASELIANLEMRSDIFGWVLSLMLTNQIAWFKGASRQGDDAREEVL